MDRVSENYKKSKKIQKSQKISKIKLFSHFFFKLRKYFFFQKNAIILVLLINEIRLQPELSSPPRFKIQGGGPLSVTDGRTDEEDGNPCV